ncbi:MAG: DUF3617 family protein [Oxalobacteraceae bacterium]|nr:MAG: DUF3617 family protein [Oxalobacteraceae bacterium]
MTKYLMLMLAGLSTTATAQVVQPGDWDVTSKVVDLTVPGVPGFLVRMMKGKSKAERKHLSGGQGIEALLTPDPKHNAGSTVSVSSSRTRLASIAPWPLGVTTVGVAH